MGSHPDTAEFSERSSALEEVKLEPKAVGTRGLEGELTQYSKANDSSSDELLGYFTEGWGV
jgi:hypothetical protein